MSFDLVPTNRNFKVTIPGVEPGDNADNVVITVDWTTGRLIESSRASLGFPPNSFTMNNALWGVFWRWVCDNCQSVLSPDELETGCQNDGLFITKQQCEAIAKVLANALEAQVVLYPGDDHCPENTLAVCLLEFLTQCEGFEIW